LRKRQNIRYYEVTNAHHLDAFNGLAGFNTLYIPLHVYFIEGLDRLYAHLTSGAPLPPSQVVHTTPRGNAEPPLTGAKPITLDNVPHVADDPGELSKITFTGSILRIPD
jgi:hydroxybutyrate-dimer hydrolase